MHVSELVLVLDFGSQYTQLISRRIRELSVYSEIHPFDFPVEKIRELKPKALFLSGGPQSVYGENAPLPSKEIFELGVPILGICYGMQPKAYFLGGRVAAAPEREYGRARITAGDSVLFKDTAPSQTVWMSHGDKILAAPPGFEVIAKSPNAPFAGFENRVPPRTMDEMTSVATTAGASVAATDVAVAASRQDRTQLILRHQRGSCRNVENLRKSRREIFPSRSC